MNTELCNLSKVRDYSLLSDEVDIVGGIINALSTVVKENFVDIPRDIGNKFNILGLSYIVNHLDSDMIIKGLNYEDIIYILEVTENGSRTFLMRFAYSVLDKELNRVKLTLIDQRKSPRVKTDIAIIENGKVTELLSDKLSYCTMSSLVN